MSDFRSRLFQEYSTIQSNIEKLKAFILSDRYDDLEEIDREDLKEQLFYMNKYCHILSRRVYRQCNNT